MQMHNIANQNVLGKSYVKFVLYFISIFIPPFGLILGMLISMTPFKYKEQLYSDMITYSCGVTTVLMGLAVAGIVVISVVCLILSFIN